MSQPKDYSAIMLSSTFTDLEEHRRKAIDIISRLGLKPEVMEHSGARADIDVIETSLKMVRDSAAYVGIISRKYGQTPADPVRNPNRLSITELEFNEAMAIGRPILLFIMSEQHPVIEADVEIDPDKRTKLAAFRERAKRMCSDREVHRVYEVFDSSEKFSTSAAIAIGNLTRHLPVQDAPGPTIDNVPIREPRNFLGRDNDLAAIDNAFKSGNGRAAVSALHGLRGVGKTTLAAAYAERRRANYRATWWIRAETEPTMRADLIGLGVRLNWLSPEAAEEPALKIVMDRLCNEGDRILLIYDNANSAREFEKWAPRRGAAHVIVTSNAPDWGGVAAPVEIEVWPAEIGADFLIERTGLTEDRAAALDLSDALGGLPLAHEQAAAYCGHLGIGLAAYAVKFAAAPSRLLADDRTAPEQYHNGLTVSKTFALAIEEAAKLHPAAELLIVYAALLAPEPIPLQLFSDGRQKFSEPLTSSIKDDGLDEAIAALRAFSLLDRYLIEDEREPSVKTDCIRLHRVVRQVAATRRDAAAGVKMRDELVAAMAAAYPNGLYNDPKAWLKARRLDAIALALVDEDSSETAALASVLSDLAAYRHAALASYESARPYCERALAITEKTSGPEHPDTATSLNNLGGLLRMQGDLAGARSYYERALAIREKALGPEHPGTATSLNNLGGLLRAQEDIVGARPYYERALAIREKVLGPQHPDTAGSLINLGGVLRAQGNLAGARPYYERALEILEGALGPEHPDTATGLNNLGYLLLSQRDLAGARPYFERALAISEKVLGPEHPDTATSLNNLGYLLQEQGDFMGARLNYVRALDICERKLGPSHQTTKMIAKNARTLFDELKRAENVAATRRKSSPKKRWSWLDWLR